MTAGANYSKICAKKDAHPGVRKKWQQLCDGKAREERAENVACDIKQDTRQGKLCRDSIFVYSWKPEFLSKQQKARKIKIIS